jgi:hypothetical protein
MNARTILAVSLLASCLALAACSKKASEPVHTPKQAKPAESEAVPARTSFEEPPEDVLRKFMFKAYEKMDDAGGVPLTVTASGKSGMARLKLYEVRKTDCKLIDIPHVAPPGMFECTVNLKVKMWWDGQREPREPSDDNKRIAVIQDDRGNWLDCDHEAEKNKEFCDVRAARKRASGK